MMWTTSDIDYLREHAAEGSKAIAAALNRSQASIKMQASRIGLSLARVEQLIICPQCGRQVSHLIKTKGYCELCKREKALQAHRDDIARIKRERALSKRDEQELSREYQRQARNLRKQKSTLKSKSNTN